MDTHVTVISISYSKRNDALQLGANTFLYSTDKEQLKVAQDTLDFVLAQVYHLFRGKTAIKID
jgi:D-arabinose 1-dehydrogenase-like Zn-dependent alcohol dehydrogenase